MVPHTLYPIPGPYLIHHHTPYPNPLSTPSYPNTPYPHYPKLIPKLLNPYPIPTLNPYPIPHTHTYIPYPQLLVYLLSRTKRLFRYPYYSHTPYPIPTLHPIPVPGPGRV